jgi:hypothetical protein
VSRTVADLRFLLLADHQADLAPVTMRLRDGWFGTTADGFLRKPTHRRRVMKRKEPITMAAALLLGVAVIPALPGVSIRSAAAADEPRASAHLSAGKGLVRAVDADTNTLVLETRSGAERVHVARAATIRDDHDAALALGEIKPGDAVAYDEVASGDATVLHVARQFWAIPREG